MAVGRRLRSLGDHLMRGAPPVMPFFVKHATVRVPAASSPVRAAARRPVDDLLRDAAFEGAQVRALAAMPASR